MLVSESVIPYLFKDTTAFLHVIEKHKYISNSTLLVTMDVISLYTNIPHDEAIEYITEQYKNTLQLWHKYNTKVLPVSVENIQKLLTFCLSHCEFSYNNKFFKQNYGLPMGAPAAVRVANIFMYKHLTEFILNYNLPLPPYFGRLIDDIFFTWKHTEEDLLQLHFNLNNFHRSIKFELTYSREKINYIKQTIYYILLYISNQQIEENIYTLIAIIQLIAN